MTMKNCQCDWCKNISPKLHNIENKLLGEDKEFFRDFVNKYITIEEKLDWLINRENILADIGKEHDCELQNSIV